MKNKTTKIGVLIATSLSRTALLFDRSLPSVLKQNRLPDYILIIDDNIDQNASEEIQQKLNKYRFSNLFYIKNFKTKGMSGSGAWNSGLEWYQKYLSDEDFIAILDDDDSWNSSYLSECEKVINECDGQVDEIAAFLKRDDCQDPSYFDYQDLTFETFLVRNPGIQGSNMFFKYKALKSIKGFDEKLASCTDRDLLIRFLNYRPKPIIKIIPYVLINHYTENISVTYDLNKKERGLDSFYLKYIRLYTKDALESSLSRSRQLFSYANDSEVLKLWDCIHKYSGEEKIGIGIALHNRKKTIRQALESALNQKGVKSKLWILIADDNSDDDWKKEVSDLLSNPRVIVWKVYFSNVPKVRNFINEFMNKYFANIKLFGRLDSDDVYAAENVLSAIEQIKLKTDADVIFSGNYLKRNEKRLKRLNIATPELLNKTYLIHRLKRMAKGVTEAELPSCNTFLTKKSLMDYPELPSAEDHYLTAMLLINEKKLKLAFAQNILLTIYNLDGNMTNENKKRDIYLESRKKIFKEALKLCRMINEKTRQ